MASPSPPTKDPRTRILTHMNADHHDSLIRYLEHYHSVSSWSARRARLTDISLSSMTIATSASTHYRIPFDPPLSDWSDTRPRVVAMDEQCVAALGRDAITLKEYRAPNRRYQIVVMALVVFTFALFGRRQTLEPGPRSLLRGLAERFPGVFAWLWRVRPWVLIPMVGIHLAEAVYMDRSRLRRHSVPRGSRVWWLWVGSTFLEGYGAFLRVDGIVRRERKRREKLNH